LKLVVGALAAGLGVSIAFSALIYCVDRVVALRRAEDRVGAAVFQIVSMLAGAAVIAIVAYGLILTVSKPK
jgi:hypothetical protein